MRRRASAALFLPLVLLSTGSGRRLLAEGAEGPAAVVIPLSKEPVRVLRALPDGLVAAGAVDGRIFLLDPVRATLVATLRGHTAEVTGLDVSPDGSTLASASTDKTLRLWDLATRTPRVIVRGPTEALSGVVYAPDGKRLVTPGYRRDEEGRVFGLLTVWAIRKGPAPDARVAGPAGSTGEQVPDADEPAPEFAKAVDFGDQPIVAVAFTSDGSVLLVGTSKETVGVLQGTSLVREAALTLENGAGAGKPVVDALAVSADGRTVYAACRDGQVRVVETKTRTTKAPFAGHTAALSGVAVRADGAQLATSSLDGTVRVWDTGTRRPIATLQGAAGVVRAVTYTKDGARIVSAWQDGHVRVFASPVLPGPGS